jgi:hypothetical protein
VIQSHERHLAQSNSTIFLGILERSGTSVIQVRHATIYTDLLVCVEREHMGEKKVGGYHHGQTIKEFREKCGMTQFKLAELWPKTDGAEGVNWRYVQDVE